MEQIAYLPLGARAVGRITKIKAEPSAKLGRYSATLKFEHETATELGAAYADRGFFGLMFTEKRADTIGLKVGDAVNVQIVSYRTSDFGGQQNTAAQVAFINKAEAVRVEAAAPAARQEA